MSRKPRRKQEWWESATFWRRTGIVAIVLAFVAIGSLVIFAGGGGGGDHTMPSAALNEPAPAFQLPTITGGETSLQENLGKHNVLLYFNEGMG